MALTFIRGLIHICMIVILKKLVEQPDAVVLFDEVDKAGEIKYLFIKLCQHGQGCGSGLGLTSS